MERNTITNGDDVFELVEEFPLGYHIWNIVRTCKTATCLSAGSVLPSHFPADNASNLTP